MEQTANADLMLVQRAQNGDSRAFDLLVLKYQHKVASVISKYVSEQDIIEDLVQDSFIKAYRAISGFRGEAGFFTWMYRIATNTAKNHLESMGRKPSYRGRDIDELVKVETPDRLRDYDTPDNLLAQTQLNIRLQETIAQLPEDLRVAITLREFEDRSYQEISDIMDTPIGTVRSRIFRAREVIEHELKQLMSGSDRAETSQMV
jgi:RNA polymerase sigma-70 factor (ECF subfamily)